MPAVTMRQLLEAGVHFGHQTSRWNPKMRPWIFSERNGIHILDLRQTLEASEQAYQMSKDIAANGGTVLFVGSFQSSPILIQTPMSWGRCNFHFMRTITQQRKPGVLIQPG